MAWKNLDEAPTEASARRMPWGICSDCGEVGPLPPFGEGQCFLCATDGPAGAHTPAISALDEDADARRNELPEFDEDSLESQVRDIFNDARSTRARLGQSGWQNLEEDITDEFAPYAQRYNEIDDAYERVSSHRKKTQQEARRLRRGSPSPRAQPGSPSPRAQAHREKTENDKRWRERVALLVLAGYCAKCKKKREPSRSHATYCAECAADLRRRIARKQAEHVAAGRCRRGCGRPLSKGHHRGKPSRLCEECSAKRNARDEHVLAGYCAKCKKKREPSRSTQTMHCEDCAAELRRRTARKQAKHIAAGRCGRGCGRPLSKRRYHGKPATLCEECSAKRNAHTEQKQADTIAAGFCRTGCGRPIRTVEHRYRGKGPPTLCEECAAKARDQMAQKKADKLAAGRCITGCGRPIRKAERRPRSSGKPPVMCEECAAKQRTRTKRDRLARKQNAIAGSEPLARSSTTSAISAVASIALPGLAVQSHPNPAVCHPG